MFAPMGAELREPCLVCAGTRWIADPEDSTKSLRCPYCDEAGQIQVHLPADYVPFGDPLDPKPRKPR